MLSNMIHQPRDGLRSNQDTWIAIDWGSSKLRIWLLNSARQILAHSDSDQGSSNLRPAEFENILLEKIATWLPPKQCTTVIACGMLGSRLGWSEVPYTQTPCTAATTACQIPSRDPSIAVYICPGIKQPFPADVMRGEETQIAGFLAQHPNFNGPICLPGTHSKWVEIKAGKVHKFQTYLTGELYGLLANQSILKHSLNTQAWDKQAFSEALLCSVKHPASIAAKLFSLRAQALIDGRQTGSVNAALSGYLIGLELADKGRSYRRQTVFLIGESILCLLYEKALSLVGINSSHTTAETLTLEGLSLAFQELQKSKAE
ncbi:MAG: hypothetical protein OFPII_32210 [Osedax symbiont Rs1]|nr:MAG: hypothetical protein OFPII_32210 [Osedax symbiont Rs1]